MLVEMHSPVFIENGNVRPIIKFEEGLNVILGKEDGANSIGKSSAMLAIDFVFGGNTYKDSDAVKHVGHHTIFFAFKFGGQLYRFARKTDDFEKVIVCDEKYNLTDEEWAKEAFTEWLKSNYKMDFSGLSFRTTMSSFFRIYGKSNTDELHPLRGIPGQGMEKSIEMLIKLYNYYKDIEVYKQGLKEQDDKLSAYKEARKYRFVSDIVGGQEKYEENLAEINQLQMELDSLTMEQTECSNSVDIEKGKLKEQLTSAKLRIETEIQTKQRKQKLLDLSLEYGLSPTEADLSELQDFFPEVNLRKIYEVEKYHQKLAAILDKQFAAEKEVLSQELDRCNAELKEIQNQINELGFIGNISKEFLDRHSELQGKIRVLKTQNEAYVTLKDLQEAKKSAADHLKEGIEGILRDLEQIICTKMKEYNDTLYDDTRKPPRLQFNAYNSYSFETPDDTGTGSNYKGMVIYDLSVLDTSALPAIAHDSLILKNISDQAIDGIMKIYEKSQKQIFIAFDKQDAYSSDTQKILSEHCVLKLSDNNCELYGRSWNKEE